MVGKGRDAPADGRHFPGTRQFGLPIPRIFRWTGPAAAGHELFCGSPARRIAILRPGGPWPVRIANPIYDVVFKYLLDDEKVARLVLSALLGTEVLELQFRPTEVHHEAASPDGTQLLVLRMDFSATVGLEDGGRKLVLIEVQKARSAWDV